MHERLDWRALILAMSMATGCGFSVTMARTGKVWPSRPEGCEFELLTALPTSGYIEIAVIDLQSRSLGERPREASEFKEAISPHVCEAGGDAALAHVEGGGLYVKATVLKRAVPASTAQNAEPSEPRPTGNGCEYDTQCKGERICVDRRCVDPAP